MNLRPRTATAAAFVAAAVFLWCTGAAFAERSTVAHVIDGDTVVLTNGDRIRLIGVNTPETAHDGRPAEPLGDTARARLEALIGEAPVDIEPGRERYDRHHRRLAWLRNARGVDLQQALIEEGLGFAIAIPPNDAHIDAYLAAEADARRAGRGVFRHPYFTPIPATEVERGGFQRVRGVVTEVTSTRNQHRLQLGGRFVVSIRRADWNRHFPGEPHDLDGREIVVRGWVARSRDEWLLSLGHPAMVERGL